MNLKNFKVVSQDKDSYTVEHPSGKKLFIEKAKLSPEGHKAILHLYQGAQVEGGGSTADAVSALGGGDPMASIAPQPSALPTPEQLDQVSDLGGGNSENALKSAQREVGVDTDFGDELAKLAGASEPIAGHESKGEGGKFTRSRPNVIDPKSQAAIDAIRAKEGPVQGDADYKGPAGSEEQAIAKAQSAIAGRSPDASQDPLVQNKSDINTLLQGQIQQQEEALGATQAAGKNVADIQEGEATKLQALPSMNEIVAGYQNKDQKLAQAYADSTLEPQRFMHQMGTGSKILTGIGMVLSGMGSATTGQPSYAMQVINDAVNRDIDAQKNDQSKKMNLWKMNREAMGNDLQANLATENQIKAGVLAKLQAAQTRAMLPAEKLRAQQAINQIQREMLENNLRRGLLTQGTQATGATGGNALSGADPSTLVPEMVKDPAQQKGVYEEIRNRSNIAKNGAEMLKAFDRAANEVSGAGGVIHSAIEHTPGQLQLKQLMMPNMSELDGTIRQAAVDAAENTIIPSAADLGRKERIAAKRQSLVNWMNSQSAAPISKGNYIDLDRFQKTAIPNFAAPAAAPMTQTMHGHTYQKVQGGWKLVK